MKKFNGADIEKLLLMAKRQVFVEEQKRERKKPSGSHSRTKRHVPVLLGVHHFLKQLVYVKPSVTPQLYARIQNWNARHKSPPLVTPVEYF